MSTNNTCPLCGEEDGGTSCGAHPCGLIDGADDKLLADTQALDEAYAGTMPAEQYNADLLALVEAVRATIKAWDTDGPVQTMEDMRAALDQFEPWLDAEETPQQMGWVDSKGQP